VGIAGAHRVASPSMHLREGCICCGKFLWSARPSSTDIVGAPRHFANVPTPDIPGVAVVASGWDANRFVAAHLPPTEPRGRPVTLTCYGRSEAADAVAIMRITDLKA
jgi:hypothetical protein